MRSVVCLRNGQATHLSCRLVVRPLHEPLDQAQCARVRWRYLRIATAGPERDIDAECYDEEQFSGIVGHDGACNLMGGASRCMRGTLPV